MYLFIGGWVGAAAVSERYDCSVWCRQKDLQKRGGVKEGLRGGMRGRVKEGVRRCERV